MKAIRVSAFGEPDVLKLTDVPDPKPAAGQVSVKVKAIGVNPVDVYVRAGLYPAKPALPYTPGADAAGDVLSVGPDVKSVKPGDRVYLYGSLTGTYAEIVLCTVDQIHPLPAHVTYEQGAAMGVPYGTAYRALFQRGGARPGETLLVHGASGGVGTAAVQLAHARGLRVIGTGGTAEGRELVLRQGAQHALDHHAADYLEQLMKLTENRGVDLILEMLANVNLGKDLKVLAQQGRVVVIGSRGKVEIDPRDGMTKEASILPMTLMAATPKDLVEIHAALVAGLENGTLKPVIGETFSLPDAPKAHQAVMEGGATGKVVLLP